MYLSISQFYEFQRLYILYKMGYCQSFNILLILESVWGTGVVALLCIPWWVKCSLNIWLSFLRGACSSRLLVLIQQRYCTFWFVEIYYLFWIRVLCCLCAGSAGKCLVTGCQWNKTPKKPRFVVFANFRGVNTLTLTDFMLPVTMTELATIKIPWTRIRSRAKKQGNVRHRWVVSICDLCF